WLLELPHELLEPRAQIPHFNAQVSNRSLERRDAVFAAFRPHGLTRRYGLVGVGRRHAREQMRVSRFLLARSPSEWRDEPSSIQPFEDRLDVRYTRELGQTIRPPSNLSTRLRTAEHQHAHHAQGGGVEVQTFIDEMLELHDTGTAVLDGSNERLLAQ